MRGEVKVWVLLKNAKIYCPEYTDDSDLLIVGVNIAAVGKNLRLPDFVEGK